jgi:hypothetical protein
MTTEDPLGKLILFAGALLSCVSSLVIDSGDTTQATLEWVRGHDGWATFATLIDLVAVPVLLGGVVVYWISTREGNALLAVLAAVCLTIGYVGLAAQHGSQALAFSLAGDQNVDLAVLAKTIDADELPLVGESFLALGGWLVGVLLALFALLPAPTPAKLAALGFLSVPFTLSTLALEPAAYALLGAGVLLMAIPVRFTGWARFRP